NVSNNPYTTLFRSTSGWSKRNEPTPARPTGATSPRFPAALVQTLTQDSMKECALIFFLMATIIQPCSSALAVESICPGGSDPDPNVIWCDDFDDATPLSQKYFEYDDHRGTF